MMASLSGQPEVSLNGSAAVAELVPITDGPSDDAAQRNHFASGNARGVPETQTASQEKSSHGEQRKKLSRRKTSASHPAKAPDVASSDPVIDSQSIASESAVGNGAAESELAGTDQEDKPTETTSNGMRNDFAASQPADPQKPYQSEIKPGSNGKAKKSSSKKTPKGQTSKPRSSRRKESPPKSAPVKAPRPKLKKVPIDSIEIDQERALGDLKKLSQSLKHLGQLYPALAYWDDQRSKYVLIDCRRRYRAACLAGKRYFQILVYESLSDAKKKLIEIMSNTVRKQLTLIELADALVKKRAALAEMKKEGSESGKPRNETSVGQQIAADYGKSRRSVEYLYEVSRGLSDELKQRLNETNLGRKLKPLRELAKLEAGDEEATKAFKNDVVNMLFLTNVVIVSPIGNFL
jgi:ParB/RepB/Spo0J family partition protein